ncbi:hypothetical protein C8J57DRAFT_1731382 [Mycena rebaudengoi]|nr:hypothetical protein C8J57DRAFT_1731382 [Mycena rebaudengoi]
MSVAELRIQLSEVDELITQQKRALEELEARHTSIRLQLDCVAYPVLTLPFEITSEIFIHCLPERPSPIIDRHDELPAAALEAPILLLRICKEWRRIALAVPALWSTLQLSLDIDSEEMGMARIASLGISSLVDSYDAWLARACARPLSLGFSGCLEDNLDHAVTILTRYAPQLQRIELELELVTLPQSSALITGPISFPMLQRLRIVMPDAIEDGGEDGVKIRFFADATQLREVILWDVHPAFMQLPWDHLTAFTGEHMTVADCLWVLRAAPLLIECTLGNMDDADEGPTRKLVSHSRLQKLRLPDYGFHLLRFLDLPALQALYLDDLYLGEGDESGWLLPFISRSLSLHLFSLKLRPYRSSQKPLGNNSFRAMYKLRDFEFHDTMPDFERHFLSMLDRTKETDFLPNLRSLSFFSDNHIVDSELLHALSTRCTGEGMKLESFRLIWPEMTHVPTSTLQLPSLRKLVKDGMKIHIGAKRNNLL